jgi:perosamine synthetase
MKFIPVNEPLLDGNESKYLQECIKTGWISSEGSFVKRLENLFAERVCRKFAIAVTNGSAALDAAVVALGIGPGDEIIMPTFTIISCAAAIVRSGAVPVVVDCTPDTWNMDVNQIEEKITNKTKAIMAVHIYGLPIDMDPVLAIAEKHGLKIIEDAAEAHGLIYKSRMPRLNGPWNATEQAEGRPCGSFGDISTFSFYPNKLVTTGEGGMIVTDDENIAEHCRSLRNLCFQPQKRFVHEELGWNLRMSNLQAALGVAQLERLDEFVKRKQQMGQKYNQLLADVSGIKLPLPSTKFSDNIYWVYGMVLKNNISFDAKEAMQRLGQLGVGTRPFFWPMHEQPVFKKMGLFENVFCPVAEKISRRGFYIPSGLSLTDDQMIEVSKSLKEILK